jgi:hypothetical protein
MRFVKMQMTMIVRVCAEENIEYFDDDPSACRFLCEHGTDIQFVHFIDIMVCFYFYLYMQIGLYIRQI